MNLDKITSSKKLYAIYGASGFGRQVAPLLKRNLINKDEFEDNIVFIDDNPEASIVNNYPCLSFDDLKKLRKESIYVSICIANSKIREKLWEKCKKAGMKIINIRADSSEILDDVFIDEGAVICSYSMLTSNIKVGVGLHLNHYSYIAHDCVIGDFVTFAAGVRCSGNVHIDDHAYIGSGAIIKQGTPENPLLIGKGAVIGMGAVVTKDVPAGAVVVGNPARPLIKS